MKITPTRKIFALGIAALAISAMSMAEAEAGRRHHHQRHNGGGNAAAVVGIAALMGGLMIGGALANQNRGHVQYYDHSGYDDYGYRTQAYEPVTVYKPVTTYRPVRVYRPVQMYHPAPGYNYGY